MRGRERYLVAVVVAELEDQVPHRKAVGKFDEAAPIGTAAEFAVGHDAEARLLLQTQHIADAVVLDPGEVGVAQLFLRMLAKGVPQPRGPQQAADMIGAEGRPTRWANVCHCSYHAGCAERRRRRLTCSIPQPCYFLAREGIPFGRTCCRRLPLGEPSR